MSIAALARASRALARPRFIGSLPSRQASSTAEKAKDAASSAQKGAASATASAQKYAQSAYDFGTKVAGNVGGRAQGLLGSYSAPITHNLAVAREVAKQVYVAERLAPPTSISELRAAYSSIAQQASSLPWWRSTLENGQWKTVGIYALEAYGIFCIGEMIGRRHMVGYKLD